MKMTILATIEQNFLYPMAYSADFHLAQFWKEKIESEIENRRCLGTPKHKKLEKIVQIEKNSKKNETFGLYKEELALCSGLNQYLPTSVYVEKKIIDIKFANCGTFGDTSALKN